MKPLRQILLLIICSVMLMCGANVRAQQTPTVLVVATERLSDLVLGYEHFQQVARLGFGSADKPWHTWYGGSAELQSLVYLPGYRPGAPVRPTASMVIGNRFDNKTWSDAFAALASFDRDGNGIVEGPEMRDLWIWVDFNGNGELADRDDSLRPASFYYGGFDLRSAAVTRTGHARQGRIRPFSVMVPYGSRIHLLELGVGQSWPTRIQGHLPALAARVGEKPDAAHPLAGRWRWKITNEAQWTDATRPWGPEAAGELLLTVRPDGLHGMVQYTGPHGDRINLPLKGSWRDGRAQWTSVSPLGLTRSEVRLETLYGRPVLRARAWSNRNGKISEWTWEARHDGPLE